MKKRTVLALLVTHAVAGAIGFALGIYVLPILIAPPAPSAAEVTAAAADAAYTAAFRRDLTGSDALHWGEGNVAVSTTSIALDGAIAPGPDYRLYLSPTFVQTEAAFLQARSGMVEVGPVRTFTNFVVPVGPDIDVARFTTVVVWCESFGEFITAAQYRTP